MGVKSTITLTRKEAEIKYRILYAKLYIPHVPTSNIRLEDLLEEMNDEANGGEGFENYTIKSA